MKKNYIDNRASSDGLNRFKTMLLSIPFLLLGFISFGQLGTIQIGSGTATVSNTESIPVTYYEYNYSQQIITAAEYAGGGGVAGPITKIRYYFEDIGFDVSTWNEWTVYIGNTSKTSFTSSTDWEPVASLTQVFSGTITPVANNWFEITFTAPFNYTGGNIIVAVHENAVDYDFGLTIRSYTAATSRGILSSVDYTDIDPAAPDMADYVGNDLAQIQFEGTLASCLPPSALNASVITSNSAEISWTANGTATDWVLEYGATGFTPTGVPTVTATANPTTIIGLLSNTEYDVYIRSVCSPSDSSSWFGPFTFITLCDAISAITVCEDFEDNSTTLNCWRVIDGNNDGNTWGRFLGYPNNGLVSAGIYTDGNSGANDDYLVTPNLILTGNEVMKFAYRVINAGEPNDFQVLLSTTGTSPADFTDTLMNLASYNNIVYKDTVLNLSAYTGNVYIAFHIPPGGLDGWYLFIDDVCFDICTPTPGVSASETICSLDQTLDLNTVITQGETNGVWSFDTNPSALNGSDLNLTALPYGTSSFNYIVTTGCTSDTTVATITVVQPSSAGSDGSIAVCRNQPFNLLSGLVGSANLGGVWTDPNAVVVPSGNATASNIPGQYNFKYIVSNGVCPADTAKVVVNVQGCDYLGLEDVAFEGFNLYPNPTTDLIYITNAGSSEVFNYEVLDMNGRVILKANDAITGTVTTEINLSQVEVGVYMVRVFNENADKTFRVVKN